MATGFKSVVVGVFSVGRHMGNDPVCIKTVRRIAPLRLSSSESGRMSSTAGGNISDEPGQMFGTVTPGGCEQLFIDIEALNADTPEKIAVTEARLGIINDVTLALNLASVKQG